MTNSYASGAVSGSSQLGGLVGSVTLAGGTLTDTDNYWDVETSTQSSSTAGSGLTTYQLTCPQLSGDSACAPDFSSWDAAVWGFGTNKQYPVLIIDGVIHRDSDGDGIFDMFETDDHKLNFVFSSSYSGSSSVLMLLLLLALGSVRLALYERN